MSVKQPLKIICVFGLLFLCVVALDARSLDRENKTQGQFLNILRKRILRTLHNHHFPKYEEKDDSFPETHIQEQTGSSTKHRIKRIGIAGHENIDLIINALDRGSGFQGPRLSMSGSFGKLRQMMRNAGR